MYIELKIFYYFKYIKNKFSRLSKFIFRNYIFNSIINIC